MNDKNTLIKCHIRWHYILSNQSNTLHSFLFVFLSHLSKWLPLFHTVILVKPKPPLFLASASSINTIIEYLNSPGGLQSLDGLRIQTLSLIFNYRSSHLGVNFGLLELIYIPRHGCHYNEKMTIGPDILANA